MGYTFNSAQLKKILDEIIAGICNDCVLLAQETKEKIENLQNSGSMKGPGTDKIFDYLSDVHIRSIQTSLTGLASSVLACYKEYYGSLCSQVDDYCEALVDTDELLNIQSELRKLCHSGKGPYFDVERDMKNTMKKIDTVSKQQYGGLPFNIPQEFTDADQKLQKTVDDIGNIESKYSVQIADVLTSIQNLKRLVSGLSEPSSRSTSISNYSPDKFFSNSEYAALYQSLNTVGTHYANWAANADKTDEALNGIQKQWDERAEKAARIKAGIAVFTKIAAAVVTVAVPGAGIIAGAAIQGAAGLISGAVCEGIDQWASGSAAASGGLDFGSILYEGAKTGVKDFATSVVGGYFGQLSAGAGVIKKVGFGVLENVVNEGISVGFDLVDAAVEDNFSDTWEDMKNEKLAERFGQAVTSGVTSGFVGALFDDAIGLNDLKKKKPSTKWDAFWKYSGTFVGDGAKQVVTGRLDKATSAFWEETVVELDDGTTLYKWGDGGQAFANSIVADPDEALRDFLTGGFSSTVSTMVEDTDWYEKRLSKSIRDDEQLQGKYRSYTRLEDGTVVIEGTATRERTDVTEDTYINKQQQTTITVSENEHGSKLFSVSDTVDYRVRGKTPTGETEVQEHIRDRTTVTQKTQKSGRVSYETSLQSNKEPAIDTKSTNAERAELRQRKNDYKIIQNKKRRQDKTISSVISNSVDTVYTWIYPDAEDGSVPKETFIKDFMGGMRKPGYTGNTAP